MTTRPSTSQIEPQASGPPIRFAVTKPGPDQRCGAWSMITKPYVIIPNPYRRIVQIAIGVAGRVCFGMITTVHPTGTGANRIGPIFCKPVGTCKIDAISAGRGVARLSDGALDPW